MDPGGPLRVIQIGRKGKSRSSQIARSGKVYRAERFTPAQFLPRNGVLAGMPDRAGNPRVFGANPLAEVQTARERCLCRHADRLAHLFLEIFAADRNAKVRIAFQPAARILEWIFAFIVRANIREPAIVGRQTAYDPFAILVM